MTAAVIHVTDHAVCRFNERIAPVGDVEARARILEHMPTLEIAADFGAPCVRTGDGVGLVVSGYAVVTVLSPRQRMGPLR